MQTLEEKYQKSVERFKKWLGLYEKDKNIMKYHMLKKVISSVKSRLEPLYKESDFPIPVYNKKHKYSYQSLVNKVIHFVKLDVKLRMKNKTISRSQQTMRTYYKKMAKLNYPELFKEEDFEIKDAPELKKVGFQRTYSYEELSQKYKETIDLKPKERRKLLDYREKAKREYPELFNKNDFPRKKRTYAYLIEKHENANMGQTRYNIRKAARRMYPELFKITDFPRNDVGVGAKYKIY